MVNPKGISEPQGRVGASERLWKPARPGEPSLSEGEVHVWRFSLLPSPAQLHVLESRLSADDRARADRFGAQMLRQRFVTGRAVLRTILAGYLGVQPDTLRLVYGPQGKPSLKPPHEGLRFNLSHCEDQALLAVSRGSDVGVDLERIRRLPTADRLAGRYFTSDECRWLAQAGDADGAAYSTAFLEVWCRKEAYLKSTGEALSRPLGSVRVGLVTAPDAVGDGLEEVAAAGEVRRLWRLELPGFVAALALDAKGLQARPKTWRCELRDL